MAPPEHDPRSRARRYSPAPCRFASPDARRGRRRTAGCLAGALALVLAATATTAADPTVASSTTPPARPDTGVGAAKREPGRELTAAARGPAPLPGPEGGQLHPHPRAPPP